MRAISVLSLFLIVACVTVEGTNTTKPISSEIDFSEIVAAAYTYPRDDGNRIVDGDIDLQNVEPLSLSFAATPRWVVAYQDSQGVSYWLVVLSNGDASIVKRVGDTLEEVVTQIESIDQNSPPTLLVKSNGDFILANDILSDLAPYSSPVLLADGIAYVNKSGFVVYDTGDDVSYVDVSAMSYARLLHDGQGQLLVLADASDRYDHRVLGSNHANAESIVLLSTQPVLAIEQRIQVDSPFIIEGNALIWADVDSDGEKDILTTLADTSAGAFLAVFDEAGNLKYQSDAIEQGYRWRHQLAVAPFSGQETEIAATLTPHIGGHPEIFRLNGDHLDKLGQTSGYTSHKNSTINIDTGVAGDFDADGELELLVVSDNYQQLGAISLQNDQVNAEWAIDLDASVTTNIAASGSQSHGISIAVGTNDGRLLVW